MRGFISWAKDDRSREVAEALRDWLPDLIHSLQLWSSSTDIRAGVRWSAEITNALRSADMGIICVTAYNQRAPWLLFETGALAAALPNTLVCPYLIQMRTGDLSGPLTQFQAKMADRAGTWDLVSTINGAMGGDALPPERLRRNFDRCWPTLEAKPDSLPPLPLPVQLTQTEMFVEILDAVRSTTRRPSTSLKSSQGPVRLPRSRQVDGVLELLEQTGHMNATQSVDIRRHLAQMAPPDLESTWQMIRQSTTTNGRLSDAAFLSIMRRIGTPLRSDSSSADHDGQEEA